MNRFFSLLLVFVLTVSVSAANLLPATGSAIRVKSSASTMAKAIAVDAQRTENEAAALAAEFFSQSSVAGVVGRAGNVSQEVVLRYTAQTSSQTPAVYAYTLGEDGGFVLVSADERTTPILGYGEGGMNVDSLSPEFVWWMNRYAQQLEVLSSNPARAAKAASSYSAIAPIIGSQWSQSLPWCYKCPTKDGYYCVVGCVATAVSQAMFKYKYPTTGKGSHSYTTKTLGIALSANFGATTYDWSNITATSSWPGWENIDADYLAQMEAVSTLCHHVGVACDMNYNINSAGGSGANTPEALQALVNYFGYDAGMRAYPAMCYDNEYMLNVIHTDLAAGRPIVFSARTVNNEGHCFLCEGMNSTGKLYINWGWGGSNDGYFELSLLDPEDQGIGGSASDLAFTEDVVFYTGVQPENGGKEEVGPLTYYGTKLSSTSQSISSAVTFTVSHVTNQGVYGFNGRVGMAVYDMAGNYVGSTDADWKTTGAFGAGYFYNSAQSYTLHMSGYTPGQYQVAVSYWQNGESKPRPMLTEGGAHFFKVNVTSASYTISNLEALVGDEYDMKEDVESAFTTDMIDVFNVNAENGYAILRLIDKENAAMFSTIIFTDGSELSAGTYEFNGTYEPGSARSGEISGNSVYPTFWGTIDEEGSLYVPLFLCVGGTVKVSYDKNGDIQLDVNATNTWGNKAHITLNAPKPVAADGLTHDVITYDMVKTGELDDDSYVWENHTLSSGAEYTAYVVDNSNSMMFESDRSDIVTTQSGGRITSVSVDWAAGNESGKVVVYGKSAPYVNNGSEWADMGTEIATVVYPTTSVTNLDTYKCAYVMVVGESEPIVNAIDFGWKEVNEYSITATTPTNGTITLSAASAEPGTNITATFKGNTGRTNYELVSYTIDGVKTSLTPAQKTKDEYKVSFKMPSHNVVVSAEFEKAKSRVENKVTITDGEVVGNTITIVSGLEYKFEFKADYALSGYGTHAPYQDNVSVGVSNPNMATLSAQTYSSSTGKGSFQLKAYNQGNSTLTLSTIQTDDYKATNITYTIKVVPREVMLVTEYNGKCYALANVLTNGKLAAQEGLMMNGVACLYNDGYSGDQLKWKVCSKSDGTFTIQNMNGKYLFYDSFKPATLTLTSTASAWGSYTYSDLDKECYYHAGNAIIYYDADKLFSNYSYDKYQIEGYSHGAFETSNYTFIDKPEEVVTIRTDLTPDKFSTLCLPYSFIAADGLTLYNVDNMEVDNTAGQIHFYFCRLDAGEATVPGQPYIIKSTSNVAKVYKVGSETVAPSDDTAFNGLHGTGDDILYWRNVWGTYPYVLGNVLVITAAGEIKYANNGNGGVNKNRAYMFKAEIPDTSACGGNDPVTNAPRRASLSIEGEKVPTALDHVKTADEIDWNQPVYNILGQRVDRSATGVLIQNGVKIFVQ